MHNPRWGICPEVRRRLRAGELTPDDVARAVTRAHRVAVELGDAGPSPYDEVRETLAVEQLRLIRESIKRAKDAIEFLECLAARPR